MEIKQNKQELETISFNINLTVNKKDVVSVIDSLQYALQNDDRILKLELNK